MRFSACYWLSVALASAALAEEPSATPVQLADVLERMASSSGVEVFFYERKELALLAAPLESAGVIYFASPDRFARFTLRPASASLVVVGEEVRMREADGEVVDLTGNALATVFVENFVVLWSGDRERLERIYTVEFRDEAPHWALRLVPREKPLAGAIAASTLTGDAKAMRFFPKAPIKKDYVVLPPSIRDDKRKLKYWAERSLTYALTLPKPKR